MTSTKGTEEKEGAFQIATSTTGTANIEQSFFDFSYYPTATVKRTRHVYKVL